MSNYLNENRMIREARANGKKHTPFLELLIFFVVMLVINVITEIAMTPAIFYNIFTDPEALKILLSPDTEHTELIEAVYNFITELPEWVNIYSLFLRGIMLAVPVVYCVYIERRSAASMGFKKGSAVCEYAVGLLLGAVMMSAVVALSVLSGAVEYSGIADFAWPTVIAYFVGYMIQGMAEEALFRGYYMVSTAKSASLSRALLISSAVFMLSHSANTGIGALGYVNLFLFAAFAGIYIMRRGSLWGIGALHASWNFMQGVIFGFGVSGNAAGTHVIGLISKQGYDTLNGGVFGPEGGLFVTLILFIAIGAVALSKPKKSEYVAATEKADGTDNEKSEEN